jgi:hypothetical protein
MSAQTFPSLLDRHCELPIIGNRDLAHLQMTPDDVAKAVLIKIEYSVLNSEIPQLGA